MRGKDIAGQTFGRLLAIRRGEVRGDGAWWVCLCTCGNELEVKGGVLRAGRTKSCGCGRVEAVKQAVTKHGQAIKRTHEYNAWSDMKNRCLNPKAKNYHNYGGRGITVCERWLEFANFFADMGVKPKRFTLERMENDGNYEPSNCVWASYPQQAANKRTCVYLTAFGETKMQIEWLRDARCVVGAKTLRRRIREGWPAAEAIATRTWARHWLGEDHG